MYKHRRENKNKAFINFFLVIKMSASESQPRRVELTRAFKQNTMTTKSILHITMKSVFVLAKTSLMAVIHIYSLLNGVSYGDHH